MAGPDDASPDPGSSSTPASDDKCPILEAWKGLPGVMERAASSSRICHMSPDGISRQCVIDNADIIEPLINIVWTLGCNQVHVQASMFIVGLILDMISDRCGTKDAVQVFMSWKTLQPASFMPPPLEASPCHLATCQLHGWDLARLRSTNMH